MASERNALAELAEKIGCLGKLNYSAGVIQTDELTPRDYAVIDKAQRIIAELAKVVDCKHPDKFMPLDKPYEDITIFSPVFNGFYEENCFDEEESRFILDLANAAWMCRAIAEEGANNG